MQMSAKGYNRTQKWKIEEDDRVERYNSISDKTLWIPSRSTWISVGAKSTVLCIMRSTAVRRCQMCVYYALWIDSANKGLHMVAYLFLQSATALKGPGLTRASSRFIATGALPSCAVLILAKEDVA